MAEEDATNRLPSMRRDKEKKDVLAKQDLATLDVSKLHPLSPEVRIVVLAIRVSHNRARRCKPGLFR